MDRVTPKFSAAFGASIITGIAPFRHHGPLKVGVLLPRSGFRGRYSSAERGVDVAPAIFKSLGLPDWRHQWRHGMRNATGVPAEKLIGEGGAGFGQHSIPANLPRLRKWPNRKVFRTSSISRRRVRTGLRVNTGFPTAPMILRRLYRPEDRLCRSQRGAEVGEIHARQRNCRHAMSKGIGAVTTSSTCRTRSRRNCYDPQRRCPSRLEGQTTNGRDASRRSVAGATTLPNPECQTPRRRRRSSSNGRSSPGRRHQERWQVRRTADQLRALVRPAQEAHRSAS